MLPAAGCNFAGICLRKCQRISAAPIARDTGCHRLRACERYRLWQLGRVAAALSLTLVPAPHGPSRGSQNTAFCKQLRLSATRPAAALRGSQNTVFCKQLPSAGDGQPRAHTRWPKPPARPTASLCGDICRANAYNQKKFVRRIRAKKCRRTMHKFLCTIRRFLFTIG